MSAAQLDAVLAEVDRTLDASLERLFAFLRIPSISAQPAHRADCRACAEWLAADLRTIGFDDAALVSAPEIPSGHPIVTGRSGPETGPRVLFYGHYDVQPVDPLELWSSPPFEPRVETRADGSKLIRARGASDDKGQVMTFVEACRAWKAVTGALPLGVTMMIEGEEESGGESVAPFLARHRERLGADIALVCDTGMWGLDRPAITASLRGLASGTVTIRASKTDLHSGHYGSAAVNPIHVLTRILADLRDADGRITLPGFYDAVPETPAEIRAIWDGLGFDASKFLGEIGLSVPAGERGRSVLEQTWARPTAEVNGIGGGYQGEGGKTVIPAMAMAKLSFRLVGDMDPDAVWRSFEAFVRARLPADCRAEFTDPHGSRAIALAYDSPALRRASAALEAEWGAPCAVVGAGGTIPVVGQFKRTLGLDTLMIGFALDDDQIHAPNEKYELRSFHKGVRSWVRVLAALAERG